MTQDHLPYRYICIEGNIGSGKTSLVDKLCYEYGAKKILESFEDNPFLPLFYKDQERYAFTVELFFMTERYKQLQNDLATPDMFYSNIVADYCFIKTLLFARKNLQKEEYKLFQMLFSVMNNSFPNPDLLVYIHRDTEYLLENIKIRDRHFEADIKADYLQTIQDSYFEYLRNITSFPVLILDIKNMDFVNNKSHYDTIKFLINKKYNPGVHRISLTI